MIIGITYTLRYHIFIVFTSQGTYAKETERESKRKREDECEKREQMPPDCQSLLSIPRRASTPMEHHAPAARRRVHRVIYALGPIYLCVYLSDL